jgi:hypothetical protein
MNDDLNPAIAWKPETPEQWQICADLAQWILAEVQARKWRLRNKDGTPNMDVCVKRLDEAQQLGIFPRNFGPAPNGP